MPAGPVPSRDFLSPAAHRNSRLRRNPAPRNPKILSIAVKLPLAPARTPVLSYPRQAKKQYPDRVSGNHGHFQHPSRYRLVETVADLINRRSRSGHDVSHSVPCFGHGKCRAKNPSAKPPAVGLIIPETRSTANLSPRHRTHRLTSHPKSPKAPKPREPPFPTCPNPACAGIRKAQSKNPVHPVHRCKKRTQTT